MRLAGTKTAAAFAVLVAWHGVLLSLPHTHRGEHVRTEVAHCTAAVAGSGTFHFHRAVEALPDAPCLACLAGSTAAALPSGQPAPGGHAGVPIGLTGPQRHGAVCAVLLPPLRAPPVVL